MEDEQKPYYRELKPSMLRRKKNWNYRGRGIYMVTMVTRNRQRLLGEVSSAREFCSREEVNFTPTEIGDIAAKEAERISQHYPQIRIIGKQVMPDHVHLLLYVQEEIPIPLGQVISGYKYGTMKAYLSRAELASTEHGMGVGAEVSEEHGMGVGKDQNRTSIDTLWEEGFNDRILFHEGQLEGMIRYIKDNPWRLAMKRAYPDLFRIYQQVPVVGYTCTTLGNQFLLDYPAKKALQCSRTLTDEDIDHYKEQCLQEAQMGMIFVSPAVSKGEKLICRALHEARYPMIILLEKGFPALDSPYYKYYKPQGVYFEACAAGRLLLIEPSDALFDKPEIEAKVYAKTSVIPHDSLRYRFVALNALADEIAGEREEG